MDIINNIAYSNNWDVKIIPPNGVKLPLILENSIFIRETSLPSYSVDVITSFIYGEKISRVKTISASDSISLSILGDKNYDILRFFEQWHDSKNVTKNGIKLLNYPDNYFGKLIVDIGDCKNKVNRAELRDVYPTSIPDIRLLSEVGIVNYEIPIMYTSVKRGLDE